MASLSEILSRGQERGQLRHLPYAGALTPSESHTLLQIAPHAKLIDVRTRAELEFVGRIPGSVEIEWQGYPGGERNPAFLAQLEREVDREALVMFICRSGVRSHAAAAAAAQAGYTQAYNVLEGFQGDKDADGHRDTHSGWRVAGLPWHQS
jgi:rhodanese-related sulfurtransferase